MGLVAIRNRSAHVGSAICQERTRKDVKPVRYAYSITSAMLAGGAALTLFTGYPAGAQVAQNDDARIDRMVPRAGAPASFADLVEQLQPAVVNISTRQRVEIPSGMGNPFSAPGQPVTREGTSLGSGFLISADGYVVTNNHVIAPGNRNAVVEEITVTMPDGTEYAAELIGTDPASDLAVLKIEGDGDFPFVRFGESEQARVGDWVIAIGNPFGLGGTVTSGIVSSVLRNTGPGAFDRYIQTDAAINRGNSGGPLFDLQGNVIGINNAIFSTSGGSIGIGFAIPADTAAPIVRSLIDGEEIQRGYLGVGIRPVDEDLADALGLDQNRGEFISQVQPDQAAARAGIEAGDVVISVDGQAVTRDQTLSYLVANITPGTSVPIELIRDGRRRTVEVTVGQRPSDEELAVQSFNPDDENSTMNPQAGDGSIESGLGLQVLPVNATIARQLGMPADTQGLVIAAVDPSSDAAVKGLRRGDVIISANYRDVADVAALEAAIAAAREDGRSAMLLRVQRRGGAPAYVPIRLR